MKRLITFVAILTGLLATSQTMLWAQSSQTSRTIILEKFTASWCGLCPEGSVTYDKLHQEFAENLFGINIHVNDPMTIPTSDELSDVYTGGGVNTFLVDRYHFPDQQFVQFSFEYEPLKEKIAERLAATPPVQLSFEDITFDEANSELSVNLSAIFDNVEHSKQYRWNLWIVEDSVSRDVPGYAQVNYFNTYEGHQYRGAGNPIPNYVHRNVLREALGGAWGSANSIPESVAPNQTITYNYQTTLHKDWNLQHIRLVAIIQSEAEEWKERAILNAAVISLFPQDASEEENPEENPTNEEEQEENPTNEENPEEENNMPTGLEDSQVNYKIKAYPNPVQDQLYLQVELNKTSPINISLVNMLGEKVQLLDQTLATGKHAFTWNRRKLDLALGLYFLQIESPDHKQTLKIILAD